VSRTARTLLQSLSLALLPLAAGAIPPIGHDGAPDTIAARVQGCATCHGASGEGTADESFPRIAGKPAGYIFNQLTNFRDGRRSYPPMNYLLEYLHDDYFKEMAAFFAAQRLPFGAPEKSLLPAAELARGGELVHQGDASRGIPPCTGCHGPRLTGIEPGIPSLLGLHSRYISAQIEAWRAGTRHAKAPDCMSEVAGRLTEPEITEAAAWLAAQSASASAVPAREGSWRTPLACGSEP
jgi:cytochrome c553